MPCIDGRERHDEVMDRYASGILCAVIRTYGITVLNNLDYKQLGLTQEQCHNWWYYHEHMDEYYNQPYPRLLNRRP